MSSLERKAPVKASPRNLIATEWSRRIVAPPFRKYLSFKRFKLIDENWRNVPRSGPVLILANHVGFFDPVKLIFGSRRTIHFLTSQATMTDPGLAIVMQLFGAVPKQKGAADPKAIRGLQAWAKVGGAVGLFPEGERSWDGRQLEFLPGIERLIRLLRIPVVTARIENADLVMPRWAEFPRRGNVRVTFDEPREFGKKADKAEIRAWVEERLRVDPGNCWRAPVRGHQLARGLTNLLYMCPACGELEGLVESDEKVSCRACGIEYAVDTGNLLHSSAGRDAIWEVAPDLDRRLEEQMGAKFDADPSAELMRSQDEVEALKLGDPGDPVESIAHGTLVITGETVSLVGPSGDSRWQVPTERISAATIELSRRPQIFLKDGTLIEMRVPRESVVKFKRVLDLVIKRIKAAKKAKKSA